MEFIEKNKWAIICSLVAVILIATGIVNLIMKLIIFVAALIFGVYIDRTPEKIKEFFKNIKEERKTKEAEKVKDNKN